MSKNLYYMGLNTTSKHYFFYSIFNELLSIRNSWYFFVYLFLYVILDIFVYLFLYVIPCKITQIYWYPQMKIDKFTRPPDNLDQYPANVPFHTLPSIPSLPFPSVPFHTLRSVPYPPFRSPFPFHFLSVYFRADKLMWFLCDSYVILGLYLGDSAVNPNRISHLSGLFRQSTALCAVCHNLNANTTHWETPHPASSNTSNILLGK